MAGGGGDVTGDASRSRVRSGKPVLSCGCGVPGQHNALNAAAAFAVAVELGI